MQQLFLTGNLTYIFILLAWAFSVNILRCSNFFYIYVFACAVGKDPSASPELWDEHTQRIFSYSKDIIMEIYFSLSFIIQIQIIFVLKCHQGAVFVVGSTVQ